MISQIIRYSSIISTLIPIIVFLAFRNNIKVRAFSYINIAFIISILSEVVMSIFIELRISNYIIGNIYVVIFITLIILFYKNILPGKAEWLYVFLVLYFAFQFINSIFFQGIFEYQGYSRAVGGILLILCSVMYFNYLITKLPVANIMRHGLFWINTGILYYYSFNLLLFIFTNYVFTNLSAEVGMVFWSFHNVNNIVKNILFCMGIYYASKS